MKPKKTLLIVVVALVLVVVIAGVALVVLSVLSIKPPVAVYDRPTPLSSQAPEELLPATLAGRNRYALEANTYTDSVDAIGSYDGGVEVEITRFDFESDASRYIAGISAQSWGSGSKTWVTAGEQQWFTFTGGGTSYFAWRKGGWVFEVTAPTDTVRNQVADALGY